MVIKLHSAIISGIEAQPITIEVSATRGLPGISIVGLASKSIMESRERVYQALKSSNFNLDILKYIINLQPANLPKSGSQLDLAMAVGMALASKDLEIPIEILKDSIFLGELSLSGEVHAIDHLITYLDSLKNLDFTRFFISRKSFLVLKDFDYLRSLFQGITFYCIEELVQLNNYNDYKLDLDDISRIIKETHLEKHITTNTITNNFDSIVGQDFAKKGLIIAATGKHHLLMQGPPGCGKTSLAKAFKELLPDLKSDQILHKYKLIESNLSQTIELDTKPVFREPHHSSTPVAILGGGKPIKPGEITFAHNGVLFLDEFTEFNRYTLEQLRQVLENKSIKISRNSEDCLFNADFIMVAAMNPCPCGFLGTNKQKCLVNCTKVTKYMSKLSGPLLDRVDIVLNISSVDPSQLKSILEKYADKDFEESSPPSNNNNFLDEDIASLPLAQKKVIEGREFLNRHGSKIFINTEAKEMMEIAMMKIDFSARVYKRVINLAKTIAALKNKQVIDKEDISMALILRQEIKS